MATISRRSLRPTLGRLIVVALLLLGVLVTFGPGAHGTTQQATPPATSPALALFTAWPPGVTLLAATELELTGDTYEWQVTALRATDAPGEVLDVHDGVLIAVSGPVLVQVNGTEVSRVAQGSALVLREGDQIRLLAETSQPVDVETVELAREADVAPDDTPDQTIPITLPGGTYTLVQANVPENLNEGTTPQQVIAGAIRPGVSISHTQDAIPATLAPGRAR